MIINVICEHEESNTYIVINNTSEEEASMLFEEYNTKYSNGEISCDYETYFKKKGVKVIQPFEPSLTINI